MLRGNYLFTKDDVTHSFPLKNQNYLRTNISRLTKKGVIISPWRNFYVAVPEEYRLKGVVPPLFYIDSMMRFFGMPYYVALLSAASLYGAAHQVPQFFMVMTNDDIRSIDRNGIRIVFVSRKRIPTTFLAKKRVQTGDVNVSSPALTTLDLIEYERNIGGLGRACEVLVELMEKVDFIDIGEDFYNISQIPVYQRLGYLLEEVLGEKKQADLLFEGCKKAGLVFRKTPLKKGKATQQAAVTRWKMQVNTEIEMDEL